MVYRLYAMLTWERWTSYKFNRSMYNRIFPWPVIIAVIFGLKFKFAAGLPSTLGKNSLVTAAFVVSSN
jgi:hypothetical protein